MKSLLLLIAVLLILHVSGQEKNLLKKKLAPGIFELKSKANVGIQELYFVVASDIQQLKQYLLEKKLQQQIVSEYPPSNLIIIQLNWKLVDSVLLPSSLVKFVDLVRTPKEETAIDGFDLSTNKVNVVHSEFVSLNGNGTVISVKENRPDSNDIDLKGRLLSSSSSSLQMTSHATIMSTIIAGAGNSYKTGKGVAWAANITSSNFTSLLPDSDADYKQSNISVQNHSYGTAIENYYGADAAAYDASTISNQTLLHVFSAGNSGHGSSTTGLYKDLTGYANLTGSFKMAKNIITVGSVDSFNTVSLLSSRGPAYDGRVRPELVAFGQDGSSGAAAIVSGTALLLQQAYQEKNSGQLAPAPLLKAILLNTADDVGATGIDFQSGYGSLNAYNAVLGMVNQKYFSNAVSAGETQHLNLNVPPKIRRLKITLCWNDVPANTNTSKALVNDIDLRLIHTSSGSVWLPWVLNSFPHKDSLIQFASRKKDSLNNTEQITVDSPEPGAYTIEVNGYNVPSGQMPYFISYQWDSTDQFKWQYPTASDVVSAGVNNTLRWSSTFNGSSGNLYFSTDEGNSWTLISDNLMLDKNYYQWSAPDTFTTIIFRMQINNKNFLSDTSTISSHLVTNVGFNCPDSFLIHWNKAQNVSTYTVYQLGKKYLEPLVQTMDTSIIVQKSQNASSYFAVAPSISHKSGMRNYSFDYSTQGVGCYFKNFLVDLDNSHGNLQLELGTLYNVKDVVIEKLGRDKFTTLKSIFSTGTLLYKFIDNSLMTGGNSYRVRIDLKDGKTLYSKPETVFYLAEMNYLVYPNPSKGIFQVVTNNIEDAELLIFNTLGQQVFTKRLVSTNQGLSIQHLKKGLYFIQIRQNGRKVYNGNILIQ
jgi:hypothetical protein